MVVDWRALAGAAAGLLLTVAGHAYFVGKWLGRFTERVTVLLETHDKRLERLEYNEDRRKA